MGIRYLNYSKFRLGTHTKLGIGYKNFIEYRTNNKYLALFWVFELKLILIGLARLYDHFEKIQTFKTLMDTKYAKRLEEVVPRKLRNYFFI